MEAALDGGGDLRDEMHDACVHPVKPHMALWHAAAQQLAWPAAGERHLRHIPWTLDTWLGRVRGARRTRCRRATGMYLYIDIV